MPSTPDAVNDVPGATGAAGAAGAAGTIPRPPGPAGNLRRQAAGCAPRFFSRSCSASRASPMPGKSRSLASFSA